MSEFERKLLDEVKSLSRKVADLHGEVLSIIAARGEAVGSSSESIRGDHHDSVSPVSLPSDRSKVLGTVQ